MLDREKFQILKLINDDTVYATDKQVYDQLELSVQQGSGGWGVRTLDGVILRMAKELDEALKLAAEADELHRQLKGQQLENGRLRKALDNAK